MFPAVASTPFMFILSASSCHLHLCERVYSGFSGARLGVLLLPVEAEHHLPGLSPRQQGPGPGNPADHHGEGVCDVRERGADPEIRHHQQDQPGWRWVLGDDYNNLSYLRDHSHHHSIAPDSSSAIHGPWSSEKGRNHNELFTAWKLLFK